jgi:serine/threonine-protein kinase
VRRPGLDFRLCGIVQQEHSVDSETREVEVRSGTPSDASGATFEQLDRRSFRDAERSLSHAAFVYAGAYFTAFTADWLLHVARTQFHWPTPYALAVTAIAIIGSILVGLVARRGKLPAVRFSIIAETYAVLGAVGIAAAIHDWRGLIESENIFLGVPWIGVWIVAFPNVVTLPPRGVARVGILSTLTLPVAYLLSIQSEGLPVIDGRTEPFAAVRCLAEMMIPTIVCAGIATAVSLRIFRLARDVSKARSLGNYHLVELIGRGGMGEVWKAKHRLLARPAAIKLIRGSAANPGPGTATTLRRFEREAQATAGLTSPHTVALFDFGTTADGTFYYVMELLEGMDLRTMVEKTGPVPAARAVRFLRHACASLADAHASGLIHRDIKPANLFVCRRGLEHDFVKVLDFGLVKGAADSPGLQLTAEGVTSGTPAFMAPEMTLGGPDVGPSADLYALGCVAYWLLTGRLVFEGPTGVSILVQHAKEDPVPPSRRTELPIDAALEALVLQLLAKSPDHRPANASALERELGAIEHRLGPWTQERAERWWQAHLPQVAVVRPVAPHATPQPAGTSP